MKVKIIILSCLMTAAILSIGYQNSLAKSGKDEKQEERLKIGIVSIRKIFQDCKRNQKYRNQAEVEQEKVIAELQQMRAEINAAEASLQTLKRGTKDYLERAEELSQKRTSLPLKQEFYEQQFALKDQEWTEKLYQDVLEKITEVAKQKELDLVFEKDEPEFPVNNANELMLTIRTNKLLYSEGCADITAEVMNLVDAVDND